MSVYPKQIQQLISLFSRLPGLGPKSAERLVFYLLDNHTDELKAALAGLNGQIKLCHLCNNYAVQELCNICSDKKRDHSVLAVIARPQDLAALERSHEFNGLYHILGNLLTPLEGITADDINIKGLESRIKNQESGIKEVILAFDGTIEGESTALYIKKRLEPTGIKITRLARGLPVGADLEYADEVTLRDALKNRQIL
jgi:recombination protein RecR